MQWRVRQVDSIALQQVALGCERKWKAFTSVYVCFGRGGGDGGEHKHGECRAGMNQHVTLYECSSKVAGCHAVVTVTT